jgi:hypothetical protein
MFFLTQVDTERLNIRGSRDPLGLVPLWGAFGREVVGNLTTQSNTIRGFTTLLLGFHFAERVAGSGKDRAQLRLAAFLKFEQLAGYARYLRNGDERIRGITEIKRRVEDNRRKIRIGAAKSTQILSNQKTYGLWGLYTVPTVESGLLHRAELVLTDDGRRLLERCYLPVFRSCGLGDGDSIADLLHREFADTEPEGRHARVFDALGKVMPKAIKGPERDFYHRHLVLGGNGPEAKPWQPRFAQLVEAELDAPKRLTMADIRSVQKAASKTNVDRPLADQLGRILDLEGVLVAMGDLFGFLQNRDSCPLPEVVGQVAKAWKGGLRHVNSAAISDMRGDIQKVYGESSASKRFVDFADSVRRGAFETAIDLVLDHNRFVMDVRHHAQPWIRVLNGKLDVRYRDRLSAELREPAVIAQAWESGFYLDSLKMVSDELLGAG